ncbi:hypothetical protein MMC17_007696 [Xylographa soralifera]|nr:hypothetical protein [Xylographa soralifera]
MYTIRYANLRDTMRLEEIIHSAGGCTRRDWIWADKSPEHIRGMTAVELATWIQNNDLDEKHPGRVIIVAEIELPTDNPRAVTLVSDPPGKLVVGFAVWRRLGISCKAHHWRMQHRPPAISGEEEKAILEPLNEFRTTPPIDCKSGLQRFSETARMEDIQFFLNFSSSRFRECWFLYDLFVDPLFEDSTDDLLQWGLDVAENEETCLGTFQPTTSMTRFISCGFTWLDRFQITCQDMIDYPNGEPGEVLAEEFGAGGIFRNVMRHSRFLTPPTENQPPWGTFSF